MTKHNERGKAAGDRPALEIEITDEMVERVCDVIGDWSRLDDLPYRISAEAIRELAIVILTRSLSVNIAN